MSWAEKIVWRYQGALEPLFGMLNHLPIGETKIRIGRAHLYAESVDRLFAAWAWKLGILEKAELALISRIIRPGMIVADVGANIGLYTMIMAQLVGETGQVHSFEPEPGNFHLLSKAVKELKLSQVVLHQAAVDNSTHETVLYVSDSHRGYHSLIPTGDRRRKIKIQAVKLDEILSDIRTIDFVKMDVQGLEISALNGMRTILTQKLRLGIMCEFEPNLIREASSAPDEFFRTFRQARLFPNRIEPDGSIKATSEDSALAVAQSAGYINLYFNRR